MVVVLILFLKNQETGSARCSSVLSWCVGKLVQQTLVLCQMELRFESVVPSHMRCKAGWYFVTYIV